MLSTQPFEKLMLTRQELSDLGYPSRKDIGNGGFQYLPMPGEITPPDKTLKIVALGCDLCKTNMGFLTVSKITIVDQHLKIIACDLIRPEYPIVDYMTEISGITEEQMRGITLTRKEALRKLFKLIDKNTILVGYNLELDLRALRIVHTRCVDVVVLFHSLSNLGLDTSISSLMHIMLSSHEQHSSNAIKSMQLALVLFAALTWRENYENHENNPLFPTHYTRPRISHHGWRSKQELIESVHQQLMWKYRERVIRPPTPILIGKEVVRIHVKKWQQLCNIEIALKEIERPHIPEKDDYAPGLGIRFSLMSLPISMKTKSQKKGFFVYLKVPSDSDALKIITYLKGPRFGEHPYKVELAIPRDDSTDNPGGYPILKPPVNQYPHQVQNASPPKFSDDADPLYSGKTPLNQLSPIGDNSQQEHRSRSSPQALVFPSVLEEPSPLRMVRDCLEGLRNDEVTFPSPSFEEIEIAI